ncbi:hypothetical protein FQN53_005723 [Emmonsiellopsis sp. PD_33]|nr:hypothetical protein FQN53_005723 [Emmonsiellopsis sp. PD_33]
MPKSKGKKKAHKASGAVGEHTDPFTLLNIDCLNIILAQLTPSDIIRCQMVNKLWRDHLSSWISVFGIRCHWPHLVHEIAPLDPELKEKRYKYLAERDDNLKKGKASSCRTYQITTATTTFFKVEGDYVVWLENGAVYYQFLQYREDSSCHPRKQLQLPLGLETDDGEIKFMGLNWEGYLVLSTGSKHDFLNSKLQLRIFAVDLKTGMEMWHWEKCEDTHYIPLLVGKSRIYYLVNNSETHKLAAWDLRTSDVLYETPVTLNIDWYRDSCELIRHDGTDILVCLEEDHPNDELDDYLPPPQFVVTLIDGASGRIIQRFEVEWMFDLRLSALVDGTFAVMGLLSHATRIVIDVYSSLSNGLFAKIRTDYVKRAPLRRFVTFALDPCSLCYLDLNGPRGTPLSMIFQECASDDTSTLLADRYFRVESQRRITLPRLSRDRKLVTTTMERRRFPQISPCRWAPIVRFVGEGRIMAVSGCYSRRIGLIFDFNPRRA